MTNKLRLAQINRRRTYNDPRIISKIGNNVLFYLRKYGIEKLNIPRSSIPAITHVDYSARVQTVNSEINPRYYKLIDAFKRKTGCPTIVNTSFNVRGEPIVCTPQDAYRCFMRTEMDVLVLQNQILFKIDQPNIQKDEKWMQEFELD